MKEGNTRKKVIIIITILIVIMLAIIAFVVFGRSNKQEGLNTNDNNTEVVNNGTMAPPDVSPDLPNTDAPSGSERLPTENEI